MRITLMTAIVLLTTMTSTTLLAQTPPTMKVEGIKTKSAGSLNPPNPGEACKEAKQNAIDKAAAAGFTGRVVWDKLSGGDDCKLTTTQAGHVGWFYTFTARGTFSKTGIQEPLNPQKDHKDKFKAGCQSSNGSWIENPDGSYQCNARSGETNKCFKDTPPRPCVHTN